MNTYIIRIQLNGSPSEQHYVILHQAMATIGGQRVIVSDSGLKWHLPHGEYHLKSTYDLASVRKSAIGAAGRAGLGAKVLVTKSDGIMWDNLNAA